MADQEAGDDIFVYTGGRAPEHVVNAIIDESVEEIDDEAFFNNRNLKSVVCHGGLLKVGQFAFFNCRSLQRVKMPGVKVKEEAAFGNCNNLTHVEFDDKLNAVGEDAFRHCTSPQRVNLPKVKTIGTSAFRDSGIEELECGEDLETIGSGAFYGSKLRRIAIPLKDEMFQLNDVIGTYTQFHDCNNLTTVDLVGGIHKTVASLHLESWRSEMNEEIQRINQILPLQHPREKADAIVQWIRSVISRIDHYKAEHRALLKEVATLLELALWKARLDGGEEADNNKVDDEERTDFEEVKKLAKKAKIDPDNKRKGTRVTCGADVVIKNVLPFLILE